MNNLLLWLGLVIFVVYSGGLLRVIYYEWKINRLHKELNQEIEKQKQTSQSTSLAERRIRNLKENYLPQIDRLERKRRYILEKLPFIRK